MNYILYNIDNIMTDCYSQEFDNILKNKKLEIDKIYNEKYEKKKKINEEDVEVLPYNVKKILGKQKEHENKRLLKSKAHQNKLDIEFSNILSSNGNIVK